MVADFSLYKCDENTCLPSCHPYSCHAIAPQEYEKRYKIWRAHLDFATAHNTAHKSHWVSGTILSRSASPTIVYIMMCACADSAPRAAASHHIDMRHNVMFVHKNLQAVRDQRFCTRHCRWVSTILRTAQTQSTVRSSWASGRISSHRLALRRACSSLSATQMQMHCRRRSTGWRAALSPLSRTRNTCGTCFA